MHGARGAVEIGEVRICAGLEERKGVQELLEKRRGDEHDFIRCGARPGRICGQSQPLGSRRCEGVCL